jgi:Mg/Co/Ni transporter MgtE
MDVRNLSATQLSQFVSVVKEDQIGRTEAFEELCTSFAHMEVSHGSERNSALEAICGSERNEAVEALHKIERTSALEALRGSERDEGLMALHDSERNSALEALRGAERNEVLEALRGLQTVNMTLPLMEHTGACALVKAISGGADPALAQVLGGGGHKRGQRWSLGGVVTPPPHGAHRGTCAG